jgi:hypothetical protein
MTSGACVLPLNLQAHYDLAITREALAENLAAIHPLAAAA